MKRKDWISVIALLIIIGIALVGEQFHASGEWADGAISLMTKLLPMLVFFVIAVFFRNRKGSYVAWYRKISYITFFLMVISLPFMHYFNVIGSKEEIATVSRQILEDCDAMFNEYEKQINNRASKFKTELDRAVISAQEGDITYINLLKQEYNTQTTYDNRFKDDAIDRYVDLWFANYRANKDSLNNIKKPQFEQILIQDFDAFQAAGELNSLFTQYDRYKKLLTDDFSKTTFFERKDNYNPEFTYANHESSWMNAKDIFVKMKFNFLWFLVFLVLALLASSSFIFFKDDTVQPPRKRAGTRSIYERGHKLV